MRLWARFLAWCDRYREPMPPEVYKGDGPGQPWPAPGHSETMEQRPRD